MANELNICKYMSWVKINEQIYLIDERDETIIVLEEMGAILWECLLEHHNREEVSKSMVLKGVEKNDGCIINSAINEMISLGVLEEDGNG